MTSFKKKNIKQRIPKKKTQSKNIDQNRIFDFFTKIRLQLKWYYTLFSLLYIKKSYTDQTTIRDKRIKSIPLLLNPYNKQCSEWNDDDDVDEERVHI